MSSTHQSLSELFALLQQERQRTWAPEVYRSQTEQRQRLVDEFARRTYAAVGDTIAPIDLLNVNGEVIKIDDLVANGPAVLIFFRHAGCPACNIALPYYQRDLAPTLKQLGVPLVAISPQVPERLGEIKTRHDFDFLVASDTDNALAESLGIVFDADADSKQAALAKGVSLAEILGNGSWKLPTPAIIVIDRDRVIRFIDISPDWLVRTEAETVVAKVTDIAAKVAEPLIV